MPQTLSPTPAVAARPAAADVASTRVQSIDVFRGLTILTMVFVNEVAGVSGIPAWMKHVPADADGMTFVDVVFPAFLFIVGMSIPYAVQNRIERGQSAGEIWKHVGIRTAGLLVLGFYMVNAEEMNPEATLLPRGLWTFLLFAGAILIWAKYPRTQEPRRKNLYLGLRLLGAVILLALPFFYRKGSGDELSGMTPSWWGILGLIGWAYLYAMVVYWLFRENKAAILGAMALFLAIVIGLKSDAFVVPDFLRFASQEGNLAHAASVLAGIFLALLLREERPGESPYRRIGAMLLFGAALFVAGYFLRPITGVSKIGATPAWVLYCAAICAVLFPLVYWLVDLKGRRRWAAFLEPAGQNPLLTYILPYIFYAIAGYGIWPAAVSQGAPGVVRALVFTGLILGVAWVLTRKGVRLQL